MAAVPPLFESQIPGLPAPCRGKVRDLYDLGSELLIVSTDRLSAFDVVLPTPIPAKGRVLNQLSAFWFETIGDRCPNHYLTTDTARIALALERSGAEPPIDQLAGRSMLVRRAAPIRAEFVVRGYLAGSGWQSYRAEGSVCGIPLPPGLREGDRLAEPILTPTTKAKTGHDESITHAELLAEGEPALIRRAEDLALEVFVRASALAGERGILLADSKFEFGVLEGEVVLIDECLTPDSSRFWEAGAYRSAGLMQSLDKQYVRDYLAASGWNREPPAPELPGEVVRQTTARYVEIYRRLTRRELSPT